MLVIGLTGGIGSGKSTVASYFADLGIEIIDSDQLARDVVKPGMPALKEIIAHFGADILDEKHQLQRKKLGEIVFKNPTERKWLEQLLHPLIRKQAKQLLQQVQSPYCVMVIPLLVESQSNELINRVLVVDSPQDLQTKRTQQRDDLSKQQIAAILAAQASREKRLAAADDIIHNDKDLDALRAQVLQLHQKYLQLAKP